MNRNHAFQVGCFSLFIESREKKEASCPCHFESIPTLQNGKLF